MGLDESYLGLAESMGVQVVEDGDGDAENPVAEDGDEAAAAA